MNSNYLKVTPVVPHGSKTHIIEACIKSGQLWRQFEQLHLTINMRADPNEQAFAQYLLDLGDGKLPTNEDDLIDLPEQCIIQGTELI